MTKTYCKFISRNLVIGKQAFSLFIFFQYQEDLVSNAVNTLTALRIQMLLFSLLLEFVVEGEYKGIYAEQEGNKTLKKVQPNYAIPSKQINTTLVSFTARGQKEHIHADGWLEKKRQSHGRPGWLPGKVSLAESLHETGSRALCLGAVKSQGKIVPSWGIFVLNY